MNESKEETENPIKESSEKRHCSIATIEQALMSSNIMEAEEAFAVRRWQGLRGNISEVTCDDGERSNHSLAVTESSAVNISMPNEKVSSLDVQESSELVAAQNASSISENELNKITYDFGKGNDISLSVTESSVTKISMPIEKVSPLDVRKSSEDETLRERKRKRSCENCADESVQLKNSHSVNEEQSEYFTEPLIKCRRLLSIEDSSISANSNGKMGLKHPEGNAFEDHISSKHSLALKESCDDNINMPTEIGPSLDGETSGHSLAVTESPAPNVSVSIAKVSSQDVHESSQAVATENAGNISENQISECNCVICDHWMEVTLSFPPYISIPVEKVSSTNEHESSDHEATVDTFQPLHMSENDISEVTCNNGEMSSHSLAMAGSSTANTSMPTEKVSSLYVQDSSQASQALANEYGNKIDENEVSECGCVICKVSDHLLAVKRSFASFISMPTDKVSSLDAHESSESVADNPSGETGENEFSECSKVSSLDVNETAEPRNGRQRKRKRTPEQNVDKSVSQSEDFLEPLRKYRRQCNIKEAAAPAFSKDELCGNEAVEENSYQFDSNHVSACSKLQCVVPVNSEEDTVSAISKDELCRNEAVEDNSHQSDFSHVSASSKLPHYVNANSDEDIRDELCTDEAVEDNSNQPDSSHVSASFKVPCDVPVNSEQMALNSVQNAQAMCAKMKNEELPVSVGTLSSDVDKPDTIGYLRYYLRTAYQLLFGATRQNPVGSVPLESSVHQPQESSTAQPSQSTRTRRGRVKTVWNGKAFVPEVQKRKQNAPYLRRLRPRRQ